MQLKTYCPDCGSINTKVLGHTYSDFLEHEPYDMEITEYECRDCGEEWDIERNFTTAVAR